MYIGSFVFQKQTNSTWKKSEIFGLGVVKIIGNCLPTTQQVARNTLFRLVDIDKHNKKFNQHGFVWELNDLSENLLPM